MPPKKRNDDEGLGIDDLSLPKSMVARLAKGVLPANSQIQKDAMLALTRSATVFVNYIAAASNDRAILNNKKTIGHDDVFASLRELEFEAFLPRCQQELERYQALQCTKRNDYRKRIRDEQKRDAASTATTTAAAAEEGNGAAGDGQGLDGSQRQGQDGAGEEGDTTVSVGGPSPKGKAVNGDRPAKKAKMEDGEGAAEDEDEEIEEDEEDEDEEEEEEEEEDDEDEEEDTEAADGLEQSDEGGGGGGGGVEDEEDEEEDSD